jgi:pimeloyl-ACP methyl ester carboxylesterase
VIIMDEQSELREGYAEIGDVRLHYVEAGDGPLIILLHGFPEFWYGWRQQIEPLAAARFRVVAPDMRGYNLSSKPTGVAADVPNLDRVERLPDASHWVHHDEAERVNQLLIDFFAPALRTESR